LDGRSNSAWIFESGIDRIAGGVTTFEPDLSSLDLMTHEYWTYRANQASGTFQGFWNPDEREFVFKEHRRTGANLESEYEMKMIFGGGAFFFDHGVRP
jgi:hypothetical protein